MSNNLSPTEFAFISKLVADKSAIVLEPGKEYLVAARLGALVRDEGLPSISALVDALRKPMASRLTQRVVEAMTTNETSFFRDNRPFDALKSSVLPDMIVKRAATKSLTIWSAACSTGQEPYSIWMLIRDNFPELMTWRLKIIGTDLSTEVLDKARTGSYTQLEVNRGVPAPMLVRHFDRDGVNWQIHNDARRSVEFQTLNLVEAWGTMPKPDIVFLRNVMIYFDVDTKRTILGRVRRLMAQDGYLFLGAGETTLNIDDSFQRMDMDRAGCFTIAQGRPAPARPVGATLDVTTRKEASWTPRATTSSR